MHTDHVLASRAGAFAAARDWCEALAGATNFNPLSDALEPAFDATGRIAIDDAAVALAGAEVLLAVLGVAPAGLPTAAERYAERMDPGIARSLLQRAVAALHDVAAQHPHLAEWARAIAGAIETSPEDGR